MLSKRRVVALMVLGAIGYPLFVAAITAAWVWWGRLAVLEVYVGLAIVGGIVVSLFTLGIDKHLPVQISNRGEVALHVEITGLPDDHGHRRFSVAPRAIHTCLVDVSGRNPRCLGTGAVASTEDGTPVARLDEPLCVQHTWIIEPGDVRYRPLGANDY